MASFVHWPRPMHTHIMPLCGVWYVRCEGGAGLTNFPTREEALAQCRELIGSRGGYIVIHDADGSPRHELRLAPECTQNAGSPAFAMR